MISERPIPCDLVAFMAHPDDAELICGGTLALAARQGWRVGVVDMTRGELGTRGTPQLRREEALEAAGVLGLTCRVNLDLPDGHVRDDDSTRRLVVGQLRVLRPRVVITMPREDHHADHGATGTVVERSLYLAGVAKYAASGDPGADAAPHRPNALLHAITSRPTEPSLVVDISEVIETRRKAIACYTSQFWQEDSSEPATRIAHPQFQEWVEGGLRRFGFLIGATWGEGFQSALPIPSTDIVRQFERTPWQAPQQDD